MMKKRALDDLDMSQLEDRNYKIGEVAKTLNLSTPTVRFYEKEFKQLSPSKSKGGQRFYTLRDIELLVFILESIDEGYTLDGIQTRLDNQEHKRDLQKESSEELDNIVLALEDILSIIRSPK